jgi:hypothetical protein
VEDDEEEGFTVFGEHHSRITAWCDCVHEGLTSDVKKEVSLSV